MLKNYRGTMTRRFMSGLDNRSTLTGVKPEESLIEVLKKHSGRNFSGKVTARHDGGREKRFYRMVDFERPKDAQATVLSIEYDPNRTANIALIAFKNGEKSYILHPEGLKVGDKVTSGEKAEVKLGNALALGKMQVGTVVHNIDGKIVRGAGTGATILAKEEDYVTIKLPSNEIKKFPANSVATVGVVGNIEWKNVNFGKAGRRRHMGHRPKVRGTAQNPRTHPHGGGEGRSGVGLVQPKTPWGKPARGLKTRNKKKYSNKFIVSYG
jgi:large subunit ribosomal protein L2